MPSTAGPRRRIAAASMRPISIDRRGRGCTLLACFLLLSVLLSHVKSKEIPTTNGVPEKARIGDAGEPSNGTIFEGEDDFGYQLGYSGYLHSRSSMLALNSTGDNPSAQNNTAFESPEGNGHRRFKRAVTHLYNMIVCATGCNPLAYKGYGCYCGFLGSGYPMDGIDRCCKMHDWCYDATDCPMFVEYFVPYYWKCYHGYKPICAIEHGDWGSSGSCAQRLCECDRTFSECLRRYHCPSHKAVCTSSPWRLIQNIFMII